MQDKKGKYRPLTPETQPISVESLPLPAGSATEAKQDTIIAELQQKTEPGDTQKVSVDDMAIAFKQLLNIMSDPLYVNPNTSNVRVELVNGTVTTVGTVSGITNIGGSSAKDVMLNALDDQVWATSIRNLIG